MASTVLRSRAWAVSTAIHVAIGLCLALLLGLGHGDHPSVLVPATRLVWVEPAPPSQGAPTALIDADAAVPPASTASEPASMTTARKPEAVAVRPLAPSRRTSRPKPRAPSGAVPPSSASDERPSSDGAALARGVEGGVQNGVADGVTGGLGDAPRALASVASPPELLERVVPEYPSRARALEVEGQVVLEVILDRTGRPEPDIRVLRSVPQLDAAAVTAVKQWRFRPARDAEGRPVRVVMEVPVRFVLR